MYHKPAARSCSHVVGLCVQPTPASWCLPPASSFEAVSGASRKVGRRSNPTPFDCQFAWHFTHHVTKNAPYAWGNFYACAITRFQKPQQLSWAGRGQRARRSTRAQRAETRSQQPVLLQTAAETAAGGSTGKEDLKADRRVRHYTKRLVCKNGHSLVEPPSRVFYTVSVSAWLFVGQRFFQKVYGRRLPSTSPFTLFAR